MDALLDGVPRTTPERPFFALTFDDGYRDNLTTALPVCRDEKMPITVYVTTGFAQRTHVAWWHLLEEVLRSNERIDVPLPAGGASFVCATPAQKQAAYDTIARALTAADSAQIATFVASINERFGAAAATYAHSLFLDEPQLRQLGMDPYVTLGAHGVGHGALAAQDPDEVRRELRDSRAYLTAITGSPTRHLAFPFGSSAAAGQREYQIAADEGLATAVTTRHGCIVDADATLLALPRIGLFPTDTDASLRCKLSGLTTRIASWRAAIGA